MSTFAVPRESSSDVDERLETLVTGACRFAAAHDDVRSVVVITNQRPSYQELMRLRVQADSYGLSLSMLATGGVALRRRRPS
jgi:hypothetical protein